MSDSDFAVLDSDSVDFPVVIDISCIVLPYDVSFGSVDISCNELPLVNWLQPMDNSCNSTIWFSLDVSFILMDISNSNFMSMDVSYALENDHMVLFTHESSLH